VVFQQHRGREGEKPVGFADKVVGFPSTTGKPKWDTPRLAGRTFALAIVNDGTKPKKNRGRNHLSMFAPSFHCAAKFLGFSAQSGRSLLPPAALGHREEA
jgi:hypothetical protein